MTRETSPEEQTAAGANVRAQYLAHVHSSYEAFRRGELRIPHFPMLYLEISQNCNLRCIGCFRTGVFKAVYTPLAYIREELARASADLRHIAFTSGFSECLTHPQIGAIVTACRQIKPRAAITISSNGAMPLTDEIITALKQTDALLLSIDGSKAQTYEAIRRGAKFETFMANVSSILALRKQFGFPKKITFAFTVFSNNLQELADVVELAHGLGVNAIEVRTMDLLTNEIAQRVGHLHVDKMDPSEFKKHLAGAIDTAKKLKMPLVIAQDLKARLAAHEQSPINGPNNASDGRAAKEQSADEQEAPVWKCQYPWGKPYSIIYSNQKKLFSPCFYLEGPDVERFAERYGMAFDDLPDLDELYNSEEMWRFRLDLAAGKTRDIYGNCTGCMDYEWKPPG